MSEHIFTVTEFTKAVKSSLTEKFPLPVKVTGEISNFTKSASGHIYFSLKDEGALLKCVIWKSVNFVKDFKDGDKVTVTGHISLYEPQGGYQLVISGLEKSGVGALYREFLRIKEKLEKEGLFDKNRKKDLPSYPLSIGIITSATGSVLQDIQNILTRRAPYVKKYLFPAAVQGENAHSSIIEGIRTFNEKQCVDLIIIARGGGSIEDLWEFNNEELAYEIFNSKIPTISAVGHETDFTISDFVADYRAPTPSAAAEIAVNDISELTSFFERGKTEMKKGITDNLKNGKTGIKNIKQSFYISSQIPINRKRDLLAQMRQNIADEIENKFGFIKNEMSAMKLFLVQKNPEHKARTLKELVRKYNYEAETSVIKNMTFKTGKISLLSSSLDALNPRNVMKRGFSIVYNGDGEIVSSVSRIRLNDKINVALKDGSFNADIKSIKEDKK